MKVAQTVAVQMIIDETRRRIRMNDRKDDRIEEFLMRYSKEYDYYLQAARLVQQKLEDSLQSAGVRSIVTARAKSVEHLSEKCYKRAAKNGSYESVDRIYEDIVDLAGVRVALYFPGQFDQVDSIVRSLFRVTVEKTFPPSDTASNDSADPSLGKVGRQKRFPGYKANHYHVRLKDDVTLESQIKDTLKHGSKSRWHLCSCTLGRKSNMILSTSHLRVNCLTTSTPFSTC